MLKSDDDRNIQSLDAMDEAKTKKKAKKYRRNEFEGLKRVQKSYR